MQQPLRLEIDKLRPLRHKTGKLRVLAQNERNATLRELRKTKEKV